MIDVHAHFLTQRCGRADWREVNAARFEAGRIIGITTHIASILGTWGARSPTYFPSPDDVSHANGALLDIMAESEEVRGYCVVNPNFADHALSEIDRRSAAGMIGVKVAASRRANDALLDPVAELAGEKGLPVLHHVWHGRRRDWPGQEASDAVELAELASRHPDTQFILAHLGGGGDWAHSLRVVRAVDNLWVDLSGSGVDADMLDCALEAVGPRRMLWGSDVTMDTAWAKLRYLESIGLSSADLNLIRFGNAVTIFSAGVFGAGD